MLRIEWGGKADAKSLLKEKPVDGSSETVGQVNSTSLKEGRSGGKLHREDVFICLCNNSSLKAEAMN